MPVSDRFLDGVSDGVSNGVLDRASDRASASTARAGALSVAFWRRTGYWCLVGALMAPLVVPISAFASASDAASTKEISTAKDGPERLRLIDLAISHCLARAFPETPFAADAGRAAAAYVELGESGVDVYDEIGTVVERHMQSPYASKSGGSLHVLQCLDLSRSAELARVIDKYLK
ncbi:T6SS amidase immunity protein Tai4 family protein [Alcaligenaceae bacterium C4P045]|nr:T6SS amidase immunity protein Tai4 family protein [Alcaligenaceae bacterium C4P045]